MTPDLAVALVALGTVLGLDAVTVGQTMISRPLVGAVLAGALCGALGPAAAAGVLLEAVAIETLPVGASKYPDWAPAGVVAGTIASLATPIAPALALALLGGLAAAWLGGRSMVVLRHVNGRRLAAARALLDSGDAGTAGRLVRLGILGDAARAAVVTAAGLLLVPAAVAAASHWQVDAFTTTAVAAAATLMVAASATRQMFHGATWARTLFAVGLVAGLLVLVWRELR